MPCHPVDLPAADLCPVWGAPGFTPAAACPADLPPAPARLVGGVADPPERALVVGLAAETGLTAADAPAAVCVEG